MANKITNYLGKLIGWNQTTVNILGRDVVGIEEFEYSDTTKKENAGAGIGLATVIGIMQKNNGYISVNSIVNKETIFTLYFLRNQDEEKFKNTEDVA